MPSSPRPAPSRRRSWPRPGRSADAQIQRAKDEAEVERLRRLEDTRKQIEAETSRAIDQIRGEVADLTLEATQRVVGKVLDSADQRRLIDEAIEGLDFSALERGEARTPWQSPSACMRRPSSRPPRTAAASTRSSATSASSPTPSRRRPS